LINARRYSTYILQTGFANCESTAEAISQGLASAAGDKKALTRANVEEYLNDFGIDAELASHSHMYLQTLRWRGSDLLVVQH
jgi:hypothetical protein